MTPQIKVDTSASSPTDASEKAQTSTSNSQSHTPTTAETSATADSKSIGSTRSRGSAVLARAREYNRIIDGRRSRSNSRSKSNPRSVNGSNNNGVMSQRERAMASLQNAKQSRTGGGVTSPTSSNYHGGSGDHHQHGRVVKQYRNSPTPSQKSSNRHSNGGGGGTNHNNNSKNDTSFGSGSSSQRGAQSPAAGNGNTHAYSNGTPRTKSSSGRSNRGSANQNSNGKNANGEPQEAMAIVTPELLVDALSGHEDGLLAIAERLMEHYDSGYDAMGEAIIDAFADVQKLFQHVVEAAHMEGAAYEAGRKEEEIERLKRALGGEGTGGGMGINDYFDIPKHQNSKLDTNGHGGGGNSKNAAGNNSNNNGSSPTSPLRHDEFIDQDVRDVLMDAIRKGQAPKDANKYAECYQIYENACNSASALLPVDSDHRGRLQLSIARAESMSPERACAILRYVMDDVLRSGLNSNSKVVMPDPSQRGDCVLTRPPPKMRGEDSSDRFKGGIGISADESNVLQSSEEALASLVEEMKEILSAPVYDQSPLQSVAEKFWKALSEAERCNLKNEERLEQKLATLKAEYLLAREEWEEKYNSVAQKCEEYKKKVERAKQSRYMEQARKGMSELDLGTIDYDSSDVDGDCSRSRPRPPGDQSSPRGAPSTSSSSFMSLSQHAKSIVGSFSCSRGVKTGSSGTPSASRAGSGTLRRDSSPPSAASTYLSSRKTSSSTSTRRQ